MTDAPTAAQHALSLMLQAAVAEGLDARVWETFATVIDADGAMDDLDDNDARHAAAQVLVAMAQGLSLADLAEWIETTEDGQAPLHNPAAVVGALRQVWGLAHLGDPRGPDA